MYICQGDDDFRMWGIPMKNYKNINTYGESLTLPEIFQNIGYAHNNTIQTVTIDKEKVKKDFMSYREKCVQYRERFDHYIDEFEQKRYMSPVELLVCSHYRDIDYLYHELFNRIDEFDSELSEINDWKYCRCYGHKNIKHLLIKRHLYQNSHEYFFHSNAVSDVVAMIKYHIEYFEWEDTELTEHFSIYRDVNPLEQIELYLLAIYLLDPTEYLQAVEDYATKATEHSMMENVTMLKRKHRLLFQMLGWSRRNLSLENNETD